MNQSKTPRTHGSPIRATNLGLSTALEVCQTCGAAQDPSKIESGECFYCIARKLKAELDDMTESRDSEQRWAAQYAKEREHNAMMALSYQAELAAAKAREDAMADNLNVIRAMALEHPAFNSDACEDGDVDAICRLGGDTADWTLIGLYSEQALEAWRAAK